MIPKPFEEWCTEHVLTMEFISGKSYKNNVAKWLKWIESLDKAPGGAVIDAGK